MAILLTRPEAEAATLAAELSALGIRVITAPLTRLKPVEPVGLNWHGVQGAIFTSANGAHLAPPPPAALPAFAVGARTAAAARAAGYGQVQSAGGTAEDLAALVAATARPGDGRLLHFHGVHTAWDLAGALRARGLDVAEHVVYEALAAEALPEAAVTALQAGQVSATPFFSRRAAKLFARLVAARGLEQSLAVVTAIAISPAVAAPLADLPFGAVRVAARPDRAAMIDMLRPQQEDVP